MSEIEIGQDLSLHKSFCINIPNIVTGRTFVASITRWGKSWLSRKICEECFGHAGIIIIDPEGEYISLREKYPFLIIGKDIPLQIETAEFMADKILESKISVIIDLSTTEEELGKEYVDKLLRRFFFLETTLRIPYLIVVEEGEDFGPEKGIATATCLDILRNITKKGGKRGIGILVIAHRPAWVSKGILSQCSNKAIGRIDWPGDLNVLEEYARIPKKTIEMLPTLDKGVFCFTGDWVQESTFVKVGQVKTTHLGYTPDIIPPSPRELQNVIASLQQSIPLVIEKIKPTVLPISEMKAKISEELEKKYKDKIDGIRRTADEKAERKFKTKIDELQNHIEKLSRSQALQPSSPISNVLEHPIVMSRMLELPDKARDLLIKIEREPNLTREQLAAFLTTSTNSIASLVAKVNNVFRATAIIGDGKPIRYKSILKRLFITDVAKREIEEIQLLQNQLTSLKEQNQQLLADRQRRIDLEKELRELPKLKEDFGQLQLAFNKKEEQVKDLNGQVGKLNVELAFFQKFKEFIQTIVPQVTVTEISKVPEQNNLMELVESAIQQKIEQIRSAITIQPQIGANSETVNLQSTKTIVDIPSLVKTVTINDDTMQGKILFLAKKGFLNAWRKPGEIVNAVVQEGWNAYPQLVDAALDDLVKQQLIVKKHTDRNYFMLAKNVSFVKEV